MEKRSVQSASAERPRLWTPVFIAILAVALCCFTVGQGINSGTSVYIDRLGGTATLAGIGAAIFSVAAAVARIVCGPIIDLRGRVIVIGAGTVIFLIGVLGSAISASLDLFVLWRFLQGVGFSATSTAAATAAADVLPAERLGEGIGYYGLGQAVGMSFGPALGLFFVLSDPAENLYWGMSAFAVLAIVIVAFCRYEHNIERLPETATYRTRVIAREREMQEHAGLGADAQGIIEAEGAGNEEVEVVVDAGCAGSVGNAGAPYAIEAEGAGNDGGAGASGAANGADVPARERMTAKTLLSHVIEPGALVGAIPMMILSPVIGFVVFFVGLFGTSIGVGNASVFYTIGAVTMVAVRLSSGTFMDRVPSIRIFGVACACGIVAYTMMLVVSTDLVGGFTRDALYYVAGVPYGVCLGAAMPVNQAIAVKNSPSDRWGAANGMFLLLYDVGIGTGTTIWGITNDAYGFTFTICCILVLIVVAFVSALFTYPASEKR